MTEKIRPKKLSEQRMLQKNGEVISTRICCDSSCDEHASCIDFWRNETIFPIERALNPQYNRLFFHPYEIGGGGYDTVHGVTYYHLVCPKCGAEANPEEREKTEVRKND